MYSEYGSQSFSFYLPPSTMRRAQQNNAAEMLFQGYLPLSLALFFVFLLSLALFFCNIHFSGQKTKLDTRETQCALLSVWITRFQQCPKVNTVLYVSLGSLGPLNTCQQERPNLKKKIAAQHCNMSWLRNFMALLRIEPEIEQTRGIKEATNEAVTRLPRGIS